VNSLNDLRTQDVGALKQLLLEHRRELLNLKLRHRAKQLGNPTEIFRSRRQVARIKTILGEKADKKKEK